MALRRHDFTEQSFQKPHRPHVVRAAQPDCGVGNEQRDSGSVHSTLLGTAVERVDIEKQVRQAADMVHVRMRDKDRPHDLT